MNTFSFVRSQNFTKTLDEVFSFFAEPYNLEKITPRFLKFNILTPLPIEMGNGTIIRYRLKLRGITVRWTCVISEWNPPYGFVDEQISGPYKFWRHEHIFEENKTGTKVTDKVTYQLPGLFLAPMINKLYVARDLKKIFDYRTEMMREILGL